MRILVCVKDVPAPVAGIRIDSAATWINMDKSYPFMLNRFDEFAIEEALLIKKKFPETVVEAITVGPERSALALRRTIGMGAGKGIHILLEHGGYISPFVIASMMASYAWDKGYGLILTGIMSEDHMHGQVGPVLAELLSWPCATSVVYERIQKCQSKVYVEREIEGGYRDCLDLALPAVLSIQTGINRPRYPSLSNVLRAKKALLETIRADTLQPPDSQEHLIELTYPQKSRAGKVLQGTPKEKAFQLFTILSEKAFI